MHVSTRANFINTPSANHTRVSKPWQTLVNLHVQVHVSSQANFINTPSVIPVYLNHDKFALEDPKKYTHRAWIWTKPAGMARYHHVSWETMRLPRIRRTLGIGSKVDHRIYYKGKNIMQMTEQLAKGMWPKMNGAYLWRKWNMIYWKTMPNHVMNFVEKFQICLWGIINAKFIIRKNILGRECRNQAI